MWDIYSPISNAQKISRSFSILRFACGRKILPIKYLSPLPQNELEAPHNGPSAAVVEEHPLKFEKIFQIDLDHHHLIRQMHWSDSS